MTQFNRLSIPDVIEIVPPKYSDPRGFFSETYNRRWFEAEGIELDWVQDNQSYSAEPWTVRGLHFQAPPFAQDKLVRVLRGAIYDVAVDIRRGSQTYGRWIARELSAESWNQLLIPVGFAHGFMTLTPHAEVAYKVSADYSSESEGAILWDDPDLSIGWPAPSGPVHLSEKDGLAPRFRDLQSPFTY